MKDLAQFQQGMGFYAQMPDSYNMVLNSDHPLVSRILSESNDKLTESLKPIESEIKGLEARLAALRQDQEKKKSEEISAQEKEDVKLTESSLSEQREAKRTILKEYATNNNVVSQLIDLALLQNGMLKGAALNKFLKRSVDLIK